jgi:hypothetical protein
MNANVVTALAALPGSVAGASAAIATTWISQRSQTRRELAKPEMRKRETLYGEFITEGARLLSDAFDHTLDKPETLVKLYAILGRIRLVTSSYANIPNIKEQTGWRVSFWFAVSSPLVDVPLGFLAAAICRSLKKPLVAAIKSERQIHWSSATKEESLGDCIRRLLVRPSRDRFLH